MTARTAPLGRIGHRPGDTGTCLRETGGRLLSVGTSCTHCGVKTTLCRGLFLEEQKKLFLNYSGQPWFVTDEIEKKNYKQLKGLKLFQILYDQECLESVLSFQATTGVNRWACQLNRY